MIFHTANMKKLSLTLAALFCAGSLSAAPTEPVAIGDIHYDTACEVAGTPLKLNGAGLRKIVFFKVYAGGLYVSEPTTDATKVFSDEKARRVRLGLLRDVDGADFVEALEEGLNANLTPEKKAAIEKELSGLLARRQNRGMGGAKTQVMLCGIPNVGKSTFINTFAGSARAKAADRPGVTKGKQWVSTEKFDLLDMPGVLWKKFDSKTIASNLAFIGSIKDDILDVEELAMNLLDEVRRNYPNLVAQRYKLDAETLALPPYELLEAIGRKRGLLVRGGEVNTERCAIMLVDEFRACKWGRISLERPPQRDDLADFAEENEE